MYIVFETKNTNRNFYFALTEEQMRDEENKVLFDESTTEIARVRTIKDMKCLDTEYRISYLRNGQIRYA